MSPSYRTEEYVRAWLAEPSQKNRDRVVGSMEPVIRHILSSLRTHAGDILTENDLFQAGVVGVLQALDQFRPDMDVRFVTFSWVRIRGEIIDLVRRMDPLPRRRRAKVAAMYRAENELAQEKGDWPRMEDVANRLLVDPVHVENTRMDARRRERLSLHTTIGEAGESELVEMLEAPDGLERFDDAEWLDVSRHLTRARRLLTQREQDILDLFYNEQLTQAEIGSIHGISEARVSQVRRRAIEKLRPRVEATLRTAA
ncbi:MAG: hypothetical protein COV99_10925 [Bacteroidetes bacterium CG12_big_fil_rev_8_21_14_0_65_60_17]|nr:MAG: hypothetical protein COV99_10925 [Bacteroidetes bacterium CG12_big_fil_rev_8_21_14_0_65_60_17]